MEALGIFEAQQEAAGARCMQVIHKRSPDVNFEHLAYTRVTLHSSRCRASCASSGEAELFGTASVHDDDDDSRVEYGCLCALSGAARYEPPGGNCSGPRHALMFRMPAFAWGRELEQRLRSLGGGSAPTLSQVARSLPRLGTDAPVFTTMVFGHMSKHLRRFGRRLQRLAIPNVVVYALDAEAERECASAHQSYGAPAFCLRGEGKTALQKYVVILLYLAVGREVFWFDFDSVWLKNPMPFLRSLEAERPSCVLL